MHRAGTVTWTIRTGKTSGNNVVPVRYGRGDARQRRDRHQLQRTSSTPATRASRTAARCKRTTTYFVVGTLTGSGDPRVSWNYTASFYETLVPSGNGWAIAQGWQSQHSGGAWGEWTTLATNTANDVNKVKIVAIPNLTLTATSLTATTATLAIGNHNAAWW